MTDGMTRTLSRGRVRERPDEKRPADCNAALVLGDGSVWWGRGIGARGTAIGEVCFNTSMTGYQEIMTDPSYAGQIISFTFPHIGNVGANPEDIETTTPAARPMVPLPSLRTAARPCASLRLQRAPGRGSRAWTSPRR